MRLAAAGLLLVGIASACTSQDKPLTESRAVLPDSADQVLFEVRSPMTDDGVSRGVLWADTMYVIHGQSRFYLRVTHSTFNTETGEPKGTMRADRAMYDQPRQWLEGWGNVVVTLVDGRILRSPHLVYDMPRATITSDTSFTIERGNEAYHGIGFRTDTAFRDIHCDRACGGHMPVALASNSASPPPAAKPPDTATGPVTLHPIKPPRTH